MIGSQLKHLAARGSLLSRHLCRTPINGLARTQSRSIFSATSPLLEKKTFNVPTMGDSITEVSVVLSLDTL